MSSGLVERLREAAAIVRCALQDVQPAEVDTDEAAAMLGEFAELERLAASGKVLVAPRAAAGSAWRRAGHRTPEAWLAQQSGTTIGAAKATLEAAGRLAALPATEQALRAGDLSGAQLEQVTAAGVLAPEAERALLGAARANLPLARLREERRRLEAAARSREEELARHRRIHASRYFRRSSADDGSVRLEGRVTPEVGAELWTLLRPYIDRAFDAARVDGRAEPAEAYAADALLLLARATVGLPDGAGKVPDVKLIIRVDAAALERGWTEPGEDCEADGVGPIPVDIARRYSTEAFWAVVCRDGEDIRSVTHLGRQVTARQRTAIEARDRCCVVPGCGQTFGLEIHHVDEWHLTHRTELDSLACLCWHHHGMVTRGEALLARLAGKRWRFTVHGGAVLEDPPPRPAGDQDELQLSLAS